MVERAASQDALMKVSNWTVVDWAVNRSVVVRAANQSVEKQGNIFTERTSFKYCFRNYF